MKQTSPAEGLNKLFPLGCFYILSVDKKGKPSGMIASWVMQTSFNPPLIAVSVGKVRNTYKLISQSKEFVVAMPNKHLEKEINVFGSKSGKDIDKFKETGIKTSKAKFLKTPLLSEATFNHECKLIKKIDTGDHSIFVGEVVCSWINEGKKVLMSMGLINGKRSFKEF
jgi:flavin reductase (DIM6/NTAB) family NADH-FMN oxidoreductase RutF